jgi:hypothetical protein
LGVGVVKSLRLAPALELPLDYATETGAVLGRRGSGKTHTASVIAEEMLAAGVHLARIDPLLARYGLRAPVEIDGFAVVRCTLVREVTRSWVDADFEVRGSWRGITASTNDGGRTWRSLVTNR